MNAVKSARSRRRALVEAEALESRTLLSAWATVDAFQLASGTNVRTRPYAMAADSTGNVYAVGMANDSAGATHGVVREETNGVWSTVLDVPNATFNGVAVDNAGDVFVCGQPDDSTVSHNYWLVAERAAGQTSFTVLNDSPTGTNNPDANAISLDGSGNVYVAGYSYETAKGTTVPHWIVRKEAAAQLASGRSAFTTVDDFNPNSLGGFASGLTYIGTGASAGLYEIGLGYAGSSKSHILNSWMVRKSTNGGSTWSTVDTFTYSTSSGYLPEPKGVAGDPSGNVFVVGKVDGPGPVYDDRWVVRESTNGGTSWSTVQDLDAGASSTYSLGAYAVGTDAAGNTYVVGAISDGSSNTVAANHDIVRSNSGGSWHTVDDYCPAAGTFGGNGGGGWGYSFARDSFGNLYVGSGAAGPWAIRSLSAAPTNLTAAAVSSSQINLAWANSAGGDVSGFAVWRSTDGINFTLVTTVGAGTTSFSDTGLSSGTTFYYYVTAILNSVDGMAAGSSAASNTASAST